MGFFDNLSKFLPTRKPQVQAEYFFGLNIKHGLVTGSVWGLDGNKVRIVSFKDRKFHEDGDISESPHALVEAANIALDEALADFQPEPEKILFGVPELHVAVNRPALARVGLNVSDVQQLLMNRVLILRHFGLAAAEHRIQAGGFRRPEDDEAGRLFAVQQRLQGPLRPDRVPGDE